MKPISDMTAEEHEASQTDYIDGVPFSRGCAHCRAAAEHEAAQRKGSTLYLQKIKESSQRLLDILDRAIRDAMDHWSYALRHCHPGHCASIARDMHRDAELWGTARQVASLANWEEVRALAAPAEHQYSALDAAHVDARAESRAEWRAVWRAASEHIRRLAG